MTRAGTIRGSCRAVVATLSVGLALGCDARGSSAGARDDRRTGAPTGGDGLPAAVATATALPVRATSASRGAVAEQTFRFGAFGLVHVLHAGAAPLAGTAPAHTVVFASGDGGWDANAAQIARRIAGSGDVLVLGVDSKTYLAQTGRGRGCAFPAGDFEALSQYTQHRLGVARYTPPVLVGHSSGAALVYATLAQAPRGTFPGAVALGLCAGTSSPRPFCGASRRPPLGARRRGGFVLLPDTALRLPVTVLRPTAEDDDCPLAGVQRFVQATPGAELVTVPGGHLFATADWLPAFTRALDRAAPPQPALAERASGAAAAARVDASVADLPLVQIAPAAAAGGPSDLVAVVLSGDGGWASIDREVGETLAAAGVPVVGLNTLQYFWTPRTPDGAGADLARLVAHATSAPPGGGPPRPRVVLVGYSRGADVLPFMARRLPPELRARVAAVALLGLESSIAFEFHVSDWLGGSASDERPTLPEVAALRAILPPAVPVLCLYGSGEDDSACPAAARQGGARAIAMPGGHHLGGDYPALARQILAAVH
ncbi:virulence protein [Gemmatimonadetes bacterium T265]|nr:virulence protein [Gemmatimonadetes bacterium T265]